jgi:hypothetical protein
VFQVFGQFRFVLFQKLKPNYVTTFCTPISVVQYILSFFFLKLIVVTRVVTGVLLPFRVLACMLCASSGL